jgi:hypothetical protein
MSAMMLPLQRIQQRGADQLTFMREKTKNYTKVSPVGLVSGKSFAIEDAVAATQLGGKFEFFCLFYYQCN